MISTLTDIELTDLLKSGDQLAFTEIYHRYSSLLYVYAYKLLGDTDAAKDLTQELFINLWDKRTTIDFNKSVSSYLYTAVRYKFLKLVSHQKVRTVYAEQFLNLFEEGTNSTDAYISEKDLIMQVEKLIEDLPPKMAQAFRLSRLKHKSNQDIAEELEVSEKTVKNLVSQANKHLKPKIDKLKLLLFLLNL
ncbi:RNA polymerase sigma-70 factor [Sphingobacterium lumbrici]|uniref:RNA polymerase sigma-70 factor n=1 Tax=Sphingobacterium lumbrici TaxID=2559600 RepID=UPI001F20AD98|nr:RNA polymerase sigma-70 factor [Sphingobacterium lumbrici]